jgi:hypothetical protein
MSVKYPKTKHLPWSPNLTYDDKRIKTLDVLLGRKLVKTEKLDGSNLCMTRDELFARSHSGPPTHPSFNVAKSMHAAVQWKIPEGVSVFFEYCYAVHTIEYRGGLPSYCFVFGVRDDVKGIWWGWDYVELMAAELELPTVPVLEVTTAPATTKEFETWAQPSKESVFAPTFEHINPMEGESIVRPCGPEGIVIRRFESYSDSEFEFSLSKFVREGHVQSGEHWMASAIKPQPLRKL